MNMHDKCLFESGMMEIGNREYNMRRIETNRALAGE